MADHIGDRGRAQPVHRSDHDPGVIGGLGQRPRALLDGLAERGAPQEFSAEVTPSISTDVVTDLFLADGWDPSQYGQEVIQVLDQKWSCGPAE